MEEAIADVLVRNNLIPWGKSWLIRMGILDLLYNKNRIFSFTKSQKAEFPHDAKSLIRALAVYKEGKTDLDVGESGTLLHFLLFISLATKNGRKFIRHGSLLSRNITYDPSIVYLSPEELGKLDGGTSQLQSASYLFYSRFGLGRKIENPPEMLQLTYDAVDHYKDQMAIGRPWELKRDETLLRQAVAIFEMLKQGKTSFKPKHSEDFCLARALGLITTEEGKKLFPSEANHETNRFLEMERVIADVENSRQIKSIDHRPIYSGTVMQIIQGRKISVKYPAKVGKSWPQFWKFVDFITKNRVG
ncbi:MAG: hypothetical protein HYT20_02575 [Candidatus Nealsonbacteria bacterium]|nr:hypothetical protein [Candidatus Nealsonbacteria bacterium]